MSFLVWSSSIFVCHDHLFVIFWFWIYYSTGYLALSRSHRPKFQFHSCCRLCTPISNWTLTAKCSMRSDSKSYSYACCCQLSSVEPIFVCFCPSNCNFSGTFITQYWIWSANEISSLLNWMDSPPLSSISYLNQIGHWPCWVFSNWNEFHSVSCRAFKCYLGLSVLWFSRFGWSCNLLSTVVYNYNCYGSSWVYAWMLFIYLASTLRNYPRSHFEAAPMTTAMC